MAKSSAIDLSSICAGYAIAVPGGICFVAIDPRLSDLDAAELPSIAEPRRVAEAMMARNGHVHRAAAWPLGIAINSY